MNENQNVKFIRKHGRIIPIKVNKQKEIEAAKKHVNDLGNMASVAFGASAGSSIVGLSLHPLAVKYDTKYKIALKDHLQEKKPKKRSINKVGIKKLNTLRKTRDFYVNMLGGKMETIQTQWGKKQSTIHVFPKMYQSPLIKLEKISRASAVVGLGFAAMHMAGFIGLKQAKHKPENKTN